MRNISADARLGGLWERVQHYARGFGRTLPEIRFFVLDPLEFASLLEKNVYPVSPVNIWEGRNMVSKRHRIETGQESALYYEVVQCGNPSYAYLNNTNSDMTQASVMAHVVGHCEFSELNVLCDSKPNRSEYVMHLVRKANMGRTQMGDLHSTEYWNACESIVPLISPNSQYNLANSVDSDLEMPLREKVQEPAREAEPKRAQPYSSTLQALFKPTQEESAFRRELKQKIKKETLSRRGYRLKAPCQDVMGFLRSYAPASFGERAILNYLYTVHAPQDFIMRTQIMNEGWAMYWEKKIMLELFKEKAVTGIIDYARVFSGVCYPRPFFARNPYHLGYHLWCEVEKLYSEGKVTLEYIEEKDRLVKESWNRPGQRQPIEAMTHLVRTITDYEFLRRFLTPELVQKFHLNRVDKRTAKALGIKPSDVIREDNQHVWIDPKPVLPQMLDFFAHFNRPCVFVVDTDFNDGGLLLLHRYDGRKLKKKWIEPTLRNVNLIWKAPVYLVSENHLFQYAAGAYKDVEIDELDFEQVAERIRKDEKPFKTH